MFASESTYPMDGLAQLGLSLSNVVHYQLEPIRLVQDTLRLGEGVLDESGALVVRTGLFTGRSPRDRFIVRDEITDGTVDWNSFNFPLNPQYFRVIYQKIIDYLNGCPELWIRDAYACADHRYRLNIRVVNEKPWMNLFVHNMFLRPQEEEMEHFEPVWRVLAAPGLRLDPAECGICGHHAVVISFSHRVILVAGTAYTGEIKKAVFTVLNYLMPQQHGVLSMHCAANMGEAGDTALFFGLSGTGKTTLSADPSRRLIGDDEHGWSEHGVFNFEGGCYAKTIGLSEDREPQIYRAIRPGALLENQVFVPGTRKVDYSDSAITENTRVSYPVDYIANAAIPSAGAAPKHIFFLTCDAYGILPPISRLTAAQAMYQFISGYTARIAGTEHGIKEPSPAFSACFGAPFLPLHPGRYASLLGRKMRQQPVKVWLVNTGWTGGPYGTGSRIALGCTRALIAAALNGSLLNTGYSPHPVFGVQVPDTCPAVPAELLNPRNTWAKADEYDRQALELAGRFNRNFQQYAAGVDPEVCAAAPKTI